MLPFVLTGCAQTELAAHVVKNIPEPIQQVTVNRATPVATVSNAKRRRSKGYFKIGAPYKIKGEKYYPKETYAFEQTGIASWYGPNFHGKQTANGEIFDQYALTAAHKTLQLPSMVEVTNLENGRSIIVRVNDRGPFSGARIIDLSKKSADTLGFLHQGTANVRMRVLDAESRMIAEMARKRIDTRGTEIAANENRLLAAPEDYAASYTDTYESTTAVQDSSILMQRLRQSRQAENIYAPPALGSGNIFVQAASFSSVNEANTLADSLTPYGDAGVYRADLGERIVYRVRIGPVENRARAGTLISRMEENGVTHLSNIQPIVVVD